MKQDKPDNSNHNLCHAMSGTLDAVLFIIVLLTVGCMFAVYVGTLFE